jgi:hypothetical protein
MSGCGLRQVQPKKASLIKFTCIDPGYACWNACKLLTKSASAAERADLFAGTAARFYRLTGIG